MAVELGADVAAGASDHHSGHAGILLIAMVLGGWDQPCRSEVRPGLSQRGGLQQVIPRHEGDDDLACVETTNADESEPSATLAVMAGLERAIRALRCCHCEKVRIARSSPARKGRGVIAGGSIWMMMSGMKACWRLGQSKPALQIYQCN